MNQQSKARQFWVLKDALWRIGSISSLLPIAHKFKINVVPDTKDDNELLLFYKMLMDWRE